MSKLPLLSVLLLLALLGATASAQAALVPAPPPGPVLLVADDEEEEEAEESEAEEPEDEEGACEPEEDEQCDEEAEESTQKRRPRDELEGSDRAAGDDGCLLKSASAAITVNPGKRRLRLTVHYRTWGPASVSVEALLRGVSGAVYLGTGHAHFARSGVYRDTFALAEKQTKRALAAREVSVEVRVVNSSPPCRLHLTEAIRPAKH
jgi:hypothetical protein